MKDSKHRNHVAADSDLQKYEQSLRKIAGERLRQLRYSRDEKQRDVANGTGIPKITISRLERGIQNTTPGKWRRLAEYFGVPMDHFWREEPGRGADLEGGAKVVYYGDALILRDDDSVRQEVRAIREEMVRVQQIKKTAEEQDAAVRDRLLRLVEGIFSSRKEKE